MMPKQGLSIKEVAKIVDGKLIHLIDNDQIRFLSIDSRKITSPINTLFFAIPGERNDGHKYIPDLLENGVRNFIISKESPAIKANQSANFILVNDVVEALQKLAAHHRKQYDIPTIGITGSNGKTIVKEWLSQLLESEYEIIKSPKSYNSQVGVPLSVWSMNDLHTLAIFEAGISKPGEMEKLEKIIQPSIGIITNIGSPHSENFENNQKKTREKIKLFEHVDALIYCCDYKDIMREIGILYIRNPKQIFQWSRENTEANLFINKEEIGSTSTTISATYKKKNYKFQIPFSDRANIENVIHCIATMLLLNYDPKRINERIQTLIPVSMRMQLLDGINNSILISDVYTSDLGSLEIALDFLNEQHRHSNKTVILSDIFQSGIPDKELYALLARMISERKVEKFIGIGPKLFEYRDYFNKNALFFKSTEDFLKQDYIGFRNESILIKGARVFGLERITALLQQKTHETVLEVNLNSMLHNLNYYRSKLKADTKLMVMVKAFSYGSGIYEVANLLEYHRVDYLSVAYPDEGVELRKAGIKMPIMVMNPEISSYRLLLEYNIEPEIYSFRTLNMFIEAVNKYPEFGGDHYFHLKLETGMNRLGFDEENSSDIIHILEKNPRIKVRSVFSHLAASPDVEHDDFTRDQIIKFERFSQKIKSYCDYSVMRHILNTSGIERFPEYQFDMVRLGLGLYGIGFTEDSKRNLIQAGTLKTVISQIKEIHKGDSVGYSRSFKAEKDTRIATLPIGYADGLMRTLGNGGGKVSINGQFAPYISNICMDMSMIDITEIECKEGDEVIIFGEQLPVEEFAKDMKTIPYEALTHISRRVKRIYFQD
jgi:alanine racemase